MSGRVHTSGTETSAASIEQIVSVGPTLPDHVLVPGPHEQQQRQPEGSTEASGSGVPTEGESWTEAEPAEADVRGKEREAAEPEAAEPGEDLQLLKAAARREGAAALLSELGLKPMELVAQLMHMQSMLDSISEHQKLGSGLKVDVQSLQHKMEQVEGDVAAHVKADIQALTGKMEELQRMVQQLGTAVATQASESKVDAERLQRMVQQLGTAVATQASESKVGVERLHHEVEQLGKAVADRASESKVDVERLHRLVEPLGKAVAVRASEAKDGVLFTGAYALSLAVTPDARVVWGNYDGTLHVHRLASRTSRALNVDIKGHSELISSMAVTPDGRFAVTASDDKDLRVWDLETLRCVATLKGHTNWVQAVAITPDGSRAVSGSHDATLRIWDMRDYSCLATLCGHRGCVTAVACTPDGRHALSLANDRKMRKWSLDSYDSAGVSCSSLRPLEWPRALAISSNGRLAVSASDEGAGLRVWDLSSLGCIATLGHHNQGPVEAMAVTPDGRYALCGEGSRLKLWDLVSRTYVAELLGHTDNIMSVAVEPGGHWAVSGSVDGTVRTWDLQARLALR